MALIEKLLFEEVDKVQQSIDRIKEHEPPEGYYLAFSGGKDSIVLHDLVQRSGVKHDSHFHLTTVDPPELIRYVRNHYQDVEMVRPEKSMFKLIVENRMPPTRLVRYCCEDLKENGGTGRLVLTGIRWAESPMRKKRDFNEVCFQDRSKTFLHPILDWTDVDVWEYIRGNKMPYCELYDQGFHRIGCIGCPMSRKQRQKDFERWPRFKAAYLRAFQRCIDKRKADGLPTHQQTAQEMFDWWMDENRKPTSMDQMMLFE